MELFGVVSVGTETYLAQWRGQAKEDIERLLSESGKTVRFIEEADFDSRLAAIEPQKRHA